MLEVQSNSSAHKQKPMSIIGTINFIGRSFLKTTEDEYCLRVKIIK